jgi:Ca-activated chloride channel family protein
MREWIFNALAIAVLVALGIVWPAETALGAQPSEMRAGSLLLKSAPDEPGVEALRVATTIRGSITGNVARIYVTQEFHNTADEWMDGLYVFPLAPGAAVDELEMQIGERLIQGEIRAKAEARAVFEHARREGRRASLVEQERPNLFTSSVANIAPKSSITVQIAYLESIPWRDGRYTLRLPLSITPRYTPAVGIPDTPERVTPEQQVLDIEIGLAPGFPLQSLASLHHSVDIAEMPPHGQRVRLAGRAVPADRDFELVWSPVVTPDLHAAAFAERVGKDTYALVMLTPPQIIETHAAPREVLFVIDTSGSMEGPSIVQARAALLLGVERLSLRDRFNVVRFSNDATSLFDAPESVDAASRELAYRFIASLSANGGTEMRGALELALAMPMTSGFLRQVVFITDGAVGNEAELVALIRDRAADTRLFTVGIGAAPNAHFMLEAAAAGRGSSLFIADSAQVRERMQDLFAKLERPALVDLQLQWPGALQPELAAQVPRDLYAGDPMTIVVRLPQEPSGLLSLSGQDSGGAWLRQIPISTLRGQAGIAKLWARERIGELSRQRRIGTQPGEIEAQILDVALAHHLVSELTSLVAVDVTPVKPIDAVARREQAPTSGPAGGAWANTAGLSQTATPAPLLALLGALAFSIALMIAVLPRRTRAITAA